MAQFLVLILSALFMVARCLPWDGPTQSFAATRTADWSPAPTNEFQQDFRLVPRQLFPSTVCGFIGGVATLPAVCSPASSCAWNTDENYVGCCATSDNACTFYTSCLDLNSPQPTGDKSDVYTCRGTSVCYQNTYPNNYYQWGCGSSDLATFIALTINDDPTAPTVQEVFTGNASPAQPTTVVAPGPTDTDTVISTEVSVSTQSASAAASSTTTAAASSSTSSSESTGSSTAAASSSTTSSSSSSSSSSSISSSPTTSSTQASSSLTISTSSSPTTSVGGIDGVGVSSQTSSTPTSTPPPSKPLPIGAIVGGVISGLALLFALLCFCFIGRRRGWFTSSDSNNQPPPMAYAAAGAGPPRYSTPHPMPYDNVHERKAELPVEHHDMRESVATSETNYGSGRSDVSPWGSPVPVSEGTFQSRLRLSPVSVDGGYPRARGSGMREEPIYEVQ